MTSERDIYRRIVRFSEHGSRDSEVQELLALGLLHFYKWDRVVEWEKSNPDSMIAPEKIQEFYDRHTEREIENCRKTAMDTLKGYATRYISRQNFGWGILQSLIAWVLSLLITVLIVKGISLDLNAFLGIKVGTP